MLLVLTNFFDLCFKDISLCKLIKKKNEIGYKVVIGYPRHFLLEFIKRLLALLVRNNQTTGQEFN